MKSLLTFINEGLFSKKNKCEETYNWAKELYNKENEFDDVFSLDKTTFTEDKLKKLLKRYWYERNTNDVNEESNIVVVIYHYLLVKYGYKLTLCREMQNFDVHNFKIEYKDKNNKTVKLPKSPINCRCYISNFNTMDIHWGGDIKSVDEYVDMIINYINENVK